MKKGYQMISVKEYVDMLDNEKTYFSTEAMKLRAALEKHLLATRRAATNAKTLETLLA